MKLEITIHSEVVDRIMKALRGESPRGTVILVVSWVDHMLRQKFAQEFSRGTKTVRDSLYGDGGAFGSLSSKLKVAYAAGWIDDDLFFDLNLLRKLRNDFAHSIEPLPLDGDSTSRKLGQMKTPRRVFSDWGKLRAAETEDGILLYVGDKPSECGNELVIPDMLSLKVGVPAVIGALADALGIAIGD